MTHAYTSYNRVRPIIVQNPIPRGIGTDDTIAMHKHVCLCYNIKEPIDSSVGLFILPVRDVLSISNNSLKQVAILITLAKTQNSFSNNSSNQLAIYPHLLFIGPARGRIRARKGLAIPISGPLRRRRSLPGGLGGAP
jgi:hypothetical protein